jgi:hypothetical protein
LNVPALSLIFLLFERDNQIKMIHFSSTSHKRPISRWIYASGAEAFLPLLNRFRLLSGILRPLICSVLATLLIGATAPRILLSQTPVGSSNPPLPGAGVAPTNLAGRVVDQAGRPRMNVEIQVKDPNGNLVRTFRTNELGRYCIADMTPGQFSLTHEPARPAYEGQTVVAFIPQEGLYIDWRVAADSTIAIATPLGESLDCEKFLAGESLLERIFGVVSGDTLAAGSIFGGIGSVVGVTVGVRTGPVASPSQ